MANNNSIVLLKEHICVLVFVRLSHGLVWTNNLLLKTWHRALGAAAKWPGKAIPDISLMFCQHGPARVAFKFNSAICKFLLSNYFVQCLRFISREML